jgi:hypothetical protein
MPMPHLTNYSSGLHQGCRWSEKLLPDKKLSLDGAQGKGIHFSALWNVC